MLEIAFGLLAPFSVSSGLAASRALARTSGRSAPGHSLKVLAIREAALLAGWGICCLLPHAIFLGGPISWGNAPVLWAIGGAFLIALGGFAYLIGSFLIGLFSKVPEDDAAMGRDNPPQTR
jgi:hypothetical protein